MGQRSSQTELPPWFRRVVKESPASIEVGDGESRALSRVYFCAACPRGRCLQSQALEKEHVRAFPAHRGSVIAVSEDDPRVIESVLYYSDLDRRDHVSFLRTIMDERVMRSRLPWAQVDSGERAESELRAHPMGESRSSVAARGLFTLQYCSKCKRIFDSNGAFELHEMRNHSNCCSRSMISDGWRNSAWICASSIPWMGKYIASLQRQDGAAATTPYDQNLKFRSPLTERLERRRRDEHSLYENVVSSRKMNELAKSSLYEGHRKTSQKNACVLSMNGPDPVSSNFAYECPLCLEEHIVSMADTDEDEGLASIRCGHVFGMRCIRAALRQDLRCPICREFTPEGSASARRVFL